MLILNYRPLRHLAPLPGLFSQPQMEKHVYSGEKEIKWKTPPGKGAAGLCWVELRLVGIYWISSVTKCEMNHIVNHPRGKAREEELSIKASLQSSHSHRLLESVSPADCSLTFHALGPQRWRGKNILRSSLSFFSPFFSFLQLPVFYLCALAEVDMCLKWWQCNSCER